MVLFLMMIMGLMRLSDENRQRRTIPLNQLDLYKQMLDPVWGQHGQINPDLQVKLTKLFYQYDTEGKLEYTQLRDEEGNILLDDNKQPLVVPKVSKSNMWSLLSFLNRDIRLGNLNTLEIVYCLHYLDLASDYVTEDMVETFSICVERSATVIELSQAKNGFTRRQMHTLTQENIYKEEQPPKKNLMNMGGGPR